MGLFLFLIVHYWQPVSEYFVSCYFTEFIYYSNSFLVESSRFSLYNVMSSTNNDNFTSSSPTRMPFFPLSNCYCDFQYHGELKCWQWISLSCSQLFLKKDFVLEGEGGREKDRERNIDWLPLACPQLGTEPATQTCFKNPWCSAAHWLKVIAL